MSPGVRRAVKNTDCTQSCDMQQLQPVWRRECLWSEGACSHNHIHRANVIASRFCCVYVNFHAYIYGQSELLQKVSVLTLLSIVCLFTIFVWHYPVIFKWTVGLEHTNCLAFPLAVEKAPHTPPETDWMIERSGGKHMGGKRAQWGGKRSQVSVTMVAGEDIML